MTNDDIVEVIATGPPEAMETIADRLVADRVIACVHYSDIRSTYRWNGDIEHATETRAAMHTTTERVDELVERIREAHPYDVACTLVTSIVDGNADYLAWVRQNTTRVSPPASR